MLQWRFVAEKALGMGLSTKMRAIVIWVEGSSDLLGVRDRRSEF